MKYGTFRYGQYPYGQYELEAAPGAVSQDARFRLSTLGNQGVKVSSPIINQFVSVPSQFSSVRVRANTGQSVISESITLNLKPIRIRVKSDKSPSYVICEIGTLRRSLDGV